jgi:hypothetical protein
VMGSGTKAVFTSQLPRYSSEKVLRAKLIQAISAGAGFDLY